MNNPAWPTMAFDHQNLPGDPIILDCTSITRVVREKPDRKQAFVDRVRPCSMF